MNDSADWPAEEVRALVQARKEELDQPLKVTGGDRDEALQLLRDRALHGEHVPDWHPERLELVPGIPRWHPEADDDDEPQCPRAVCAVSDESLPTCASNDHPLVSGGPMSALPDTAGRVDLFAGFAVSDYPSALEWYERLLGSPPSFLPNDHEAVWELAEHRFLYIEHRPERAGRGQHTVFMENFDSVVSAMTGRGVHPSTTETYENGVRKAVYVDPDGNELGLGGAPT